MAGRRSKLSEEVWAEVFRLDALGVPRVELARRFGVSVGTIAYQAEKRCLKKGETPGCVDRRRRPEGGWPEDHVFVQSRSGMSPARWRELLERRIAGEADADLAAEYGVSVGAIAKAAQRMGLRKMDRADARYRPRGPAQGAHGYTGIRDLLKIDVDRDDPVGTVRGLDERIWAKLAVGDGAEARTLWGVRGMVRQQLGVTTPEVRARLEQEVREARPRLPAPEAFGRSSTVASAMWPGLGASRLEAGMTTASEGDGEETDGLALHEHQRAPVGDWSTWLVLGGRGAGKTLAGAVWAADQAARLGAGGRIALIGATLHDVRTVMIEGASGILSLPRWGAARAEWRPSLRTLRFPGGCEAQAFSAEDPDSLRGPQFHAAWADEFCAWKGAGDALAMARLGLRLGDAPKVVVTTTPRPTRALKRLMGEGSCAVTRAGTQANAAHLSPGFVAGLKALYGGTRLEAQEIEGQVVDDGLALFSAEMMAGARGVASERFERVVVGVDPSVTAGGNACGIVVVGRAGEACEVLADRTVGGVSPEAWARAVVAAAGDYQAAEVVVEVNQGGELVTGLLKAVGAGLKVTGVRASVGKRARAEPVAALYEQGRVRHVGAGLERLEEELMGVGEEAGDLDRADALVWAVTHLMLGARAMTPRARSTW